MAKKKVSKLLISSLMTDWGRKGGSRATKAQKDAALSNLRKTPNFQKHLQNAAIQRRSNQEAATKSGGK